MSNDEKKFQPIFQILHIKSAWFLLELATALVTTIGMRFLQVWNPNQKVANNVHYKPIPCPNCMDPVFISAGISLAVRIAVLS